MTESPKQRFRTFYTREHATTRKILHTFPADRGAFRPAERSNTAHTLAWTFVVEERLVLAALQGRDILGSGIVTAPPERWEDVLAEFDRLHDEILRTLDAPGNEMLDGTVTFPVGPKQMGEHRTGDFVFFMIHDQIHHRGQLSVYLRMVGAPVPSIYGPSADEPWM